MGTSSRRMKLALARMERAPKIVRIYFVTWAYFFAGAMLAVPAGALLLIPFHPPRTFAAGPFQVALESHLLAAAAFLSAPPILMLFLDEDFAAWRTIRGALGRIVTLLVLSPVMLLMGSFALALAFHIALPFLENAIARPAVQTWDLPITSAERRKPAPKSCDIKLYFPDPLAFDHRLSLCAEYQPELAGGDVGDTLRITGRAGLFGITYSAVELVRH